MRTNTFKAKVLEFIAANKGKSLSRKDYIAEFVSYGMEAGTASQYHFHFVKKVASVEAPKVKDNFREKVIQFAHANRGLKRAAYIAEFVSYGMSVHTASIYHYKYVTMVKGQALVVINVPVKKVLLRDSKGRFIKRAA